MMEERVLKGDLAYESSMSRIASGKERFVQVAKCENVLPPRPSRGSLRPDTKPVIGRERHDNGGKSRPSIRRLPQPQREGQGGGAVAGGAVAAGRAEGVVR